MIVRFMSLCTFSLSVSMVSSGASLLYDNGPPAYLDNFDFTNRLQADSFTLTSATTLTNFVFWNYELNPLLVFPAHLVAPPGLDWWIYTNNASGMPGSPLASGSGAEVIASCCQGMISSLPWPIGAGFEVDVTLDSVDLGSGTYWLVLNEPHADASQGGAGDWIDTASSGNGGWQMLDPPNGTWTARSGVQAAPGSPFGTHLAFQLFDGDPFPTPEPAPAALVAVGLGALACISRCIKRGSDCAPGRVRSPGARQGAA
jgi:hypothetical protein